MNDVSVSAVPSSAGEVALLERPVVVGALAEQGQDTRVTSGMTPSELGPDPMQGWILTLVPPEHDFVDAIVVRRLEP